jgi:CelD/BcsL family acetyltransferase involved in cellulose biosynthesis
LTNSQPVTVVRMSIESLFDVCHRPDTSLEWTCPFIHPAFLKSWWRHFRNNRNLLVLGIKENDQLSGIAPIMEQSGCVQFIGNPEVFDYQDVIVVPDKTRIVLTGLFNHLKQTGISRLRLGLVRPDSFVYRHIEHSAEAVGAKVMRQKADVFYELKLTDTWKSFLNGFSGKQRHEVRRKFRRLHEAGTITFRCVDDQFHTEKAMETFFFLFKANRPDKAAFMTDHMASFFMDLAKETAKAGLLKLFFLDIDKSPASSVFCFDFGDRFYLYNNGYDYRFQNLAVGVLSKFLSIKAAIESGKKIYDFLKGDEAYKERMGGYPVPLYDFEVFF